MTAPVNDTIAMPFLVKRLRNEAECWAVAANTYTGPRLASLLLEAADEIEALQRDIERAIANHAADLSGCSPDSAAQTSLADEEAQIVKAAAERVARRSGGSPDSGEVERLRERCQGYKGQIEAGSIAIQHLQGEIDRLCRALQAIANTDGYHRDGKDCTAEIMRSFANKALPSGQDQMPHPIRCPYCNADPGRGEAHRAGCQALPSGSCRDGGG